MKNDSLCLSEQRLLRLSDLANLAHLKIQQDYAQLDPVIGINRSMRKNGIAADIMTIDCLRSGKRILIILEDGQPADLRYQFTLKDQDPGPDFEAYADNNFSEQTLYDWISGYFSPTAN